MRTVGVRHSFYVLVIRQLRSLVLFRASCRNHLFGAWKQNTALQCNHHADMNEIGPLANELMPLTPTINCLKNRDLGETCQEEPTLGIREWDENIVCINGQF